MKTRKPIAALATALMLVIGMSLAACSSGESAESSIRADLAAQFDPIKNLDQSVMDELTVSVEELGLEKYGVAPADYITSLLNGFDYSIDSVTVAEDGNSATASVTVTCKTFTDATARAEELSREFINGGEIADMGEDELNARIGEIMMQAIDETQAKSTPCEFGYAKADGTWTIDSAAESEIYNAFFA